MTIKLQLVTVIIPTFRDWNRLEQCLTALSKQSYPKEFFEVIIINNDPSDIIPANFFLQQNFKVIPEAKLGSYAARNKGIKLAKGEIIGFTDSDCIPEIDWIKNAVDYLSFNPNCSRLAGKVNLFYQSKVPTIAEQYEKLYAFNQQRYVSYGTSITANLFTYKKVFNKVGYFNERLLSGGDYMWGILADKAKFKIDYVENVIVDHPARYRLLDLIIKEKRVGTGQAFFLDLEKNLFQKFIVLLKTLKPNFSEIRYIKRNSSSLSKQLQIKIFFIRYTLLNIRAFYKFKNSINKTSYQ
jgi:glycosyltransferase involved in cell wall biosynthesis